MGNFPRTRSTTLNHFLFKITIFVLLWEFVAPQRLIEKNSSWRIGSLNGTEISLNTFRHNIETLLNDLVINSSKSGFSNSTYGRAPNKVYGLHLCRGDLTTDLCYECVSAAREWSLDSCDEDNTEVHMRNDKCTLRYANESTFAKLDMGPSFRDHNSSLKPTNPAEFNRTLISMFRDLIEDAVFNSSRFYATKEASLGVDDGTLYGLVQCMPDIGGENCSKCLNASFSELQKCCGGVMYGANFYPSCQLRYQNSRFYEVAATGTQTSNSYARGCTIGLVSLHVVMFSFIHAWVVHILINGFAYDQVVGG